MGGFDWVGIGGYAAAGLEGLQKGARGMAAERMRVGELEVIAANFKRRHTGVTLTVVAPLPVQAKTVRIAARGRGCRSGRGAREGREGARFRRRRFGRCLGRGGGGRRGGGGGSGMRGEIMNCWRGGC